MQKKELRDRQKASRRARMLEVARRKFQNEGYSEITVEDIADEADVSAVTVYNYFGSKAGLLLALVSESDLILIQKFEDCADKPHECLTDAVLAYSRILRGHAMTYLQKPTWREIVSASIAEGSRDFGKCYMALDSVLVEKMHALIVSLQKRKLVPPAVDAVALADCLFSLQNIRFFQFIADDSLDMSTVDEKLKCDLDALRMAFSSCS